MIYIKDTGFRLATFILDASGHSRLPPGFAKMLRWLLFNQITNKSTVHVRLVFIGAVVEGVSADLEVVAAGGLPHLVRTVEGVLTPGQLQVKGDGQGLGGQHPTLHPGCRVVGHYVQTYNIIMQKVISVFESQSF